MDSIIKTLASNTNVNHRWPWNLLFLAKATQWKLGYASRKSKQTNTAGEKTIDVTRLKQHKSKTARFQRSESHTTSGKQPPLVKNPQTTYHKLTRKGCSSPCMIWSSLKTFLTSFRSMHFCLFMYFMAYIFLVSFFWTMQTYRRWGGGNEGSINDKWRIMYNEIILLKVETYVIYL